MAARITIVTDGSAPAMALARWLASKGVRATVLEARSPEDVRRLVAARHKNRPRERLLALSEVAEGAELDGGPAVQVVKRWLSEYSPIEQRGAADRLEEQRLARAAGNEKLELLLNKTAAGELGTAKARRGRPRGSNPFAGVGFDVIVAMLCQPGGTWTERDLAGLVERSPSTVHRVLGELRQRGYVLRSRGTTRLRHSEILRDDLLAAWRGRVAQRPGRVLSTPPENAPKHMLSELQLRGQRCLLAGTSAYQAPGGVMSAVITVYADERALGELIGYGCQHSVAGMGNLVVWEPLERSIFYQPRMVDQLEGTNRVITYLDLAVGQSERHKNAASALWNEM